MAGIDPGGHQKYWTGGLPARGLLLAGLDTGAQKHWSDARPVSLLPGTDSEPAAVPPPTWPFRPDGSQTWWVGGLPVRPLASVAAALAWKDARPVVDLYPISGTVVTFVGSGGLAGSGAATIVPISVAIARITGTSGLVVGGAAGANTARRVAGQGGVAIGGAATTVTHSGFAVFVGTGGARLGGSGRMVAQRFVATEVLIPQFETPTGVTWVEFMDAAGAKHYWAVAPVADPDGYFGGFKEGRLLELGTVVRGLSDDFGNYEASDFSFLLDDTDRALRTLMAKTGTKELPNRSVVVRTIPDPMRRNQQEPRTVIRGVLATYKPTNGLRMQFTVRDSLALRFKP